MSELTMEVIDAVSQHCVTLGSELERGIGLRVVAAARAIERGAFDLESLYEACVVDLGRSVLFDGVDLSTSKTNEACVRDLMQAYLVLYKWLGPDWLTQAARVYLSQARQDPQPNVSALELVGLAQSQYANFKVAQHAINRRVAEDRNALKPLVAQLLRNLECDRGIVT